MNNIADGRVCVLTRSLGIFDSEHVGKCDCPLFGEFATEIRICSKSEIIQMENVHTTRFNTHHPGNELRSQTWVNKLRSRCLIKTARLERWKSQMITKLKIFSSKDIEVSL